MAMHTHFPSFRDGQVKEIHNLHHMLESRGRHVLPTLVEAPYSMREEFLRNIAKANIADDSIPAKWMLSRLLQI